MERGFIFAARPDEDERGIGRPGKAGGAGHLVVNVLVVPAPLHVQGCSVALDAVAYVLHDGMQTE